MFIPSVSLAEVYLAALTAAPVVSANAPAPEIDPTRVTPGVAGFLTFFALALAAWFLYRSFATHMRRIDVRARLQAEEDARRSAEPGGQAADAPGPAHDPADGGPAVRS